jgi:hypothetical protein
VGFVPFEGFLRQFDAVQGRQLRLDAGQSLPPFGRQPLR